MYSQDTFIESKWEVNMNPAVCILSSDKMKQKEFSFFTILCSFILKCKQTSTPNCAPIPFILVHFKEELLDIFISADQIAESFPLSSAFLLPPPVPILQTQSNPFHLKRRQVESGLAAWSEAGLEPLQWWRISQLSWMAKAVHVESMCLNVFTIIVQDIVKICACKQTIMKIRCPGSRALQIWDPPLLAFQTTLSWEGFRGAV